MSNVLVVGSWHLGSVVGSCVAEAKNTVFFWDQNPQIENQWSKGTLPIFEPGLQEIVSTLWQKNIFWLSEEENKIRKAWDWIILSYDTPVNDQDELDLTIVEEGFAFILKQNISTNTHFFFTAQLPVGTSRKFKSRIQKSFPEWLGHIFFQPENLRLGEALKTFKSPDRIVLGLDDLSPEHKDDLLNKFYLLIGKLNCPCDVMSIESAEMVKHTMNSFLATCIVFANKISDICEQTGANAWDVLASLKKDSRVGPKAFLRPGLGFAGATLARDLKVLSSLSKSPDSTDFFSTIYQHNSARNNWVMETLTNSLQDLKSKKIILLGVTYKPNTSTVRRSPAIEIARLIQQAGGICFAIDPQADLNELTDLERKLLPFSLNNNVDGAFINADAILLITDWSQFKELPWAQINSQMRKPLLIDTKNFLPEAGTFLQRIVPGFLQ